MSQTGLKVFDRTVQESNEWLGELEKDLHAEDRQRAYISLRSVLQALRDRLPPPEAVHLGAQLPMLRRGVYYEDWTISGKPLKADREEFLERIAEGIVTSGPVDPEREARAVFRILARRISAGEIQDVTGSLPLGLRELWPD